ncbi:KAP family P-loop domain protein [Lachnospiraceae bacterium JC7]|nr:KAP family P-loop domain protein [Lachnospiraceae bacterium JC7]
MNNDELNIFIKNYIENDKTGTAVMLTAPWGFGKSYYIQNSLKPYLTKSGYECIVVSLYGIQNVHEISKQIYLTLRSVKIFDDKNNKSELKSTGKAIGKTLLNFALSKIGLDIINFNEKDLFEIYESIDLVGKLIVLEDIERSEITKTDLLGYINSLTERDYVRVLLVANEDELIKKTETDGKITYSEETQIYLRYKEKTVGDTVRLSNNQSEAIKNILSEYDHLSKAFSSEDILSKVGMINLRTLKYACQKSNEILGYIKQITVSDMTYMKQFEECIFFGMISQSVALSENYYMASKWTGGKYYKGKDDNRRFKYLGSTCVEHLLFKFCFDYLIDHECPSEDVIKDTYEAYCNYCLYETDQTANDKDLSVIKEYYIQSEADIKMAVESLTHRLKNRNEIPFTVYGDLARTLIRIKYELQIDIEECKKFIIENLKGKKDTVDTDVLFVFDISARNTEEYEEYVALKDAMITSLNEKTYAEPFGFDYIPSHIVYLEIQAARRNTKENFISKFDIGNIIKMMNISNAKELNDLRGVFFAAYRSGVNGNRSIYYSISDDDKMAIKKIIDFIEKENHDACDKVQLLQLNILKDNLIEMINADT